MKLPALLLLCFGTLIKQNKGYLNTSTVRDDQSNNQDG